MKAFSVGYSPHHFFSIWIIAIVGIGAGSLCDAQVTAPAPSQLSAPAPERRVRVLPALTFCCGEKVDYLGVYAPDGKFRTTTRVGAGGRRELEPNAGSDGEWSRPSEVPRFVKLHSAERIEENYEPPARALRPVKGQSGLALLRNEIVSMVYGRERILMAPHHVAADSQGRVLIVDPDIQAVHVLGKADSFRIAGGPRRRLLLPNGVAVDAADNIYISDSRRGVILVYAPDGRFLRYIGKHDDESVFHYPTAIAIDRKAGHLFVLDSPRNLLFVLDLDGNILKRVGRPRPHSIGKPGIDTIPLDLDYPTEMAIGNNELVVVDSSNSRIHVMDLQCNPISQFEILATPGPPLIDEIGLGVDRHGAIYVSSTRDSHIRIYSRNGVSLGSMGHSGIGIGEFNSPAGLWIDGTDRLFVGDTNNGRVQVFQLSYDPVGSGESNSR